MAPTRAQTAKASDPAAETPDVPMRASPSTLDPLILALTRAVARLASAQPSGLRDNRAD